MKKSIAVLGLGKYGMSLVRSLNEMGADVLAVDKRGDNVKEIADHCDAAVCADLSDEEDLLKLGLQNMDIVVVAMGQCLEASILSVAVAKEQGVPMIVAKSSSDRMSAILRKVGANSVIMPEEHAAARSAVMLVSDTVMDYFQVGSNLCIIQMKPLKNWIGKNVIELGIRNKYQMILVAQKDEDNNWVQIDPEKQIQENSELLVALDRKNLSNLSR